MKDFAEWSIADAIENFDNYIPEYQQLDLFADD